jgi:hypothetical protein
MQAEFELELRGDVVVVVRKGAPLFEDTQKAMAAAVEAARRAQTRKILFDVRLADLTEVMSFIVRVRQMRGWVAGWFVDMDEALEWLAHGGFGQDGGHP